MDDIFERIRSMVGCIYISDLPYHPDRVWSCLLTMGEGELSRYPEKQMEDFSGYVFGVSYDILRDALKRRAICPPRA